MQNKGKHTTWSNWECRTHEHKKLDNPQETHHNKIKDVEQMNAHNPFKSGIQNT